jgi:phospholipid/cholesterol/gamma-HCH transport system substrate-binding protein
MSSNERGMEVRVGLLVLVCAGLLVAFIVVLGGLSASSGVELHLDVDTSASLKPGAPVKVAGVDAGKVKAVEYRGGEVDPAVGRPVFVRVTIGLDEARFRTLNEHARFYITTQGVLGEKYVEIEPSSRPGAALVAGGIVVGEPPLRLEQMAMNANRVLTTLSEVLVRNEGSIDTLIKDAADTMGTLKTTAKRVDALLADGGPRIAKAIERIDAIENQVEGLLTSAQAAIGDGTELRAVVRNAAALSSEARSAIAPVVKDVRSALDRYTKVGEAAEATLAELKAEAAALLGKANAVMDDAQTLTAQLKKGEGTIGALLSDRETYDDIREMMKDLKRHPWKFIWKE